MLRLTTAMLMLSVLLVCFAQFAHAGDKGVAGEIIGDSMYTDNKFGFSFVKPETWKFQEVFKNKGVERVVLIQRSPVVPPQFDRDTRRYFTQPQVTILAMETDKNPKDYSEFLLSEEGKDDLKKSARGRFQLLQHDSQYSFEKRRISAAKVGGAHARKIVGRKGYFYSFGAEAAENDPRADARKGKVLSGYISGYIYVVSTANGLLLMEFVVENELLGSIEPDLDRILDSFSIAGARPSEEPEGEPEPADRPGEDE